MGLSEGNYRSSVLFKRRSIRKFKPGKPAEWQVRALLEAAMCTPTACNGMPFELILIEDREVLDKLQKVLPFSRLRTAPMAMAVISHKDWKSKLTPCGLFIQQDLAAVSLQICLAACEVGLGACWCGVHPVKALETPARKVLGIPDDVMMLSIIPFGVPDEEKSPNEKWAPEKVHRDRY